MGLTLTTRAGLIAVAYCCVMIGCSSHAPSNQSATAGPAAEPSADPALCASFNSADGETFRFAIRDELIRARTASNDERFATVIADTGDAEVRIAQCIAKANDTNGGLDAVRAEALLMDADARGSMHDRTGAKVAIAAARQSIQAALRAPGATEQDRSKMREIGAQIASVAAAL